MDQDRIGKFIRDIRKKAGLTQQMFAQKYGVTYQAVSKWENGRNIPDLTILKQICCDYNINLNDLLDGKEGYNIEKNNHNRYCFNYFDDNCFSITLYVFASQEKYR